LREELASLLPFFVLFDVVEDDTPTVYNNTRALTPPELDAFNTT
jgi:hypothetical protein